MKYLIGIDIGTSGTKSVLFDTEGNAVASATAEYPMYQPENGWAEQDPSDWWRAVCKTLKELTEKAEGEIVGVGLSGQMHSLVMLDKDNEIIRRAILWCDQRTGKECDEITELIGRERSSAPINIAAMKLTRIICVVDSFSPCFFIRKTP